MVYIFNPCVFVSTNERQDFIAENSKEIAENKRERKRTEIDYHVEVELEVQVHGYMVEFERRGMGFILRVEVDGREDFIAENGKEIAENEKEKKRMKIDGYSVHGHGIQIHNHVEVEVEDTTRKSRTGDEVFPGDICRPGKPTKRQKSVRRGTNSDRLFNGDHTTKSYPSRFHTFFLTHTVGGVFLNPEDKALYDEMLRLQGLGSNTPTGVPYTEDEIMAIVRGGKQRGHIPGVGRVLPGQGTVIPPPSQSTHSTDIARLKKREKQLTKQVNMFMRLFRSDDKFSQMLNQFESQPEYGGGSGSGGCGDDEPGDDEDGGEDEDDS
ncbi:hypothetical protein Tco_1301479 [Tanacetum coccineum]